MKFKTLNILVILFTLSRIVMAQTATSFGLDLGITFSQFPSHDRWTVNDFIYTSKTKPLIGPLMGISKQWTVRKHLQLSSGLQYQMAGTRFYKLTQTSNSSVWADEEWENQKLHILCLPLTIGYVFKINKVQSSVYIGLRPNFIFWGRIYNKTVITNPSFGVFSSKDEFYPFASKSDYFTPAKRLVNQFSIGITTAIGQNVKIKLNYNIGHNHYTSRWIEHGNYSTWVGSYESSITSSDYGISITYLLKKPLKENSENIEKSESGI